MASFFISELWHGRPGTAQTEDKLGFRKHPNLRELTGRPGLRVFLPKSAPSDEKTAEDCQSRHKVLWAEYRNLCNKNSKQPDRTEFTNLKKEQDSFCRGEYVLHITFKFLVGGGSV